MQVRSAHPTQFRHFFNLQDYPPAPTVILYTLLFLILYTYNFCT